MTMAEWIKSISLSSNTSVKKHMESINKYIITTRDYSIACPKPNTIALQGKNAIIQLKSNNPIVLKPKDDIVKTKTGSADELR